MNGHLRLFTLAAAVVAAASLAACHDSNQGAPTPPPTTGTSENFSTFATQTFQASANSTPVNFDNISLTYDVNNDPTAFNALLM